jgi:hypothetical protein
LRKALYGLKLAHRAWYGRLRGFLFERSFEMGKVDQTLFLLRQGRDIFGGSCNSLVARFAEDMSVGVLDRQPTKKSTRSR